MSSRHLPTEGKIDGLGAWFLGIRIQLEPKELCHELANINVSVRSQDRLVFNNILLKIKLLQHVL